MLDEPNSNLDNEGEHALTRAIQECASGGIAIGDRPPPSALAVVDHILVLDEARSASSAPRRRCSTASCARFRPATPITPTRPSPLEHGEQRHERQHSVQGPPVHQPPYRVALEGVAFLVFALSWAWTTELGAVVAPGTIVVDSHVKKVQHPTGGVIGEILARDGDRVRAGDVVIRLDETVARANLSMVSKSIDEMRKARLE